jgi:hypothetical protein
VCRFHVAAGEKLHADKFPGAIVRSVAKLAGINLRKFVSFSYWFDNLGSTIEGRLAAMLIIPSSWGSQLGGHLPTINGCQKYHMVKLADICAPKEHGGIGILVSRRINKALMLKWVWHILRGEGGLWLCLINAKYL